MAPTAKPIGAVPWYLTYHQKNKNFISLNPEIIGSYSRVFARTKAVRQKYRLEVLQKVVQNKDKPIEVRYLPSTVPRKYSK